MAVSVKRPSVLPDYAHFYPGTLKGFNICPMFPAPLRAVQEKHIGSLRTGGFHSFEMLPDKSNGIIKIVVQNLAEFFVGTDHTSTE